jgi:hypothetical protein
MKELLDQAVVLATLTIRASAKGFLPLVAEIQAGTSNSYFMTQRLDMTPE